MKAIHFFYLGAGIDLLAILLAIFFVLKDMSSPAGGTNNPTMYKALLLMAAWMGVAFWLKYAGKLGLANLLLWIPASLLLAYGLMVLMFIIFKPDMR